MIYQIVKNRPLEPLQFAIQYLQDLAQKQAPEVHSDSDEDQDEVAELEFRIQKKKNQGKSKSRMGISAEVLGNIGKRESYEFKYFAKTP